MNFLNREIRHPIIALGVFFGIGILLNMYGVTQGSLFLFDLLAGVLIYKVLTS